MHRLEPRLADRRRSLLAGLLGGDDSTAEPAEVELARVTAGVIGSQTIDVGALVAGWVALRHRPGLDLELAASLAHVAERGAPRGPEGVTGGLGAALVTLPLVVQTAGSNLNVISGAYHLACILDPSPEGTSAAIAVSVVAACFLQGRRDFVPDLIEALKANQAPAELVAGMGRAPMWKADRAETGAIGQVVLLAWCLHHLSAAKLLDRLAPHGPVLRTLGAALVGARDGTATGRLPDELELVLDRLNLE